MSLKIDTYGNVTDGKVKISYRDRFMEELRRWPDCRFRMTVEKVYRKRTDPQRMYYFSVIVYECMEGFYETTGERINKDEAHELLKANCNYKEISNRVTGEQAKVGLTTTKFTTLEAEEYHDRCRKFIAEYFGRRVPMPNEGQLEAELTMN